MTPPKKQIYFSLTTKRKYDSVQKVRPLPSACVAAIPRLYIPRLLLEGGSTSDYILRKSDRLSFIEAKSLATNRGVHEKSKNRLHNRACHQ